MICRKLTYSFLAIACLIMVFTGCGKPPSPTAEIYWPPAPREPVIKYIRTISGNDLRRSFFGKVKDFFFGKSDLDAIGKPYGLVYDGKGKLFIADTARKGILVLDLKAGTTKFFNSLGSAGKLIEPVYIVLDQNGLIYVSDTELKRVAVFSPDYKFLRFIGSEKDFKGPVGMAFDKTGRRLYIVDTQNHKVKVFSPEGEFIREFGHRGDAEGEFYYPLTVAVGPDGTVYIVDSFHFAVQAFTAEGEFLFSFGSTKASMGSLARPRDIAVDSDYNIYVTDAVRNNVQIFDSKGRRQLEFGTNGTADGEFRLPAGVYIDNDDNIYISDSINNRIQMFKYLAQN